MQERTKLSINLFLFLTAILLTSTLSAVGDSLVATPIFSPDGGNYISAQEVTITCPTPGATIHYTTNGVDPSETDPIIAYPPYRLRVDRSMILKARAFKPGWDPSEVKSAVYTITVAAVTLNHEGGTYAEAQTIKLSCSTPGATIRYTTDATDPTEASALYTGPIDIRTNVMLKAKAFKSGCNPSPVKVAVYTFREPIVVYVSTDGDDGNNGLSWQAPKKTIQGGIDAAVPGDEVWVKAGTYAERIRLAHGVKLYGGFAGNETARGQRDWRANRTVVDSNWSGTAIWVPPNASAATVIDGLTIQNGQPSSIYCRDSSATIRNNTIIGNARLYYMGAIDFANAPDPPMISNNLIVGNETAGIKFYDYPLGCGGMIVNNTIVGNGNIAISCFNSKLAILNNIVAFNLCGIYRGGGSDLLLIHNCVYGNTRYNYWDYSLQGEFPHPSDISVDPLFVDRSADDYHLRLDSLCIDAGTNVGAPPVDFDGNPRPMDGNRDGIAITDIGAYESPIPVQVDVLPGVDPNVIRLRNRLVTVAILSDPVFNARNIDPTSVVFGPGKAPEVHSRGHWEDVNQDGLVDLLLHFLLSQSGIAVGDQGVTLHGRLNSGEAIMGSDSIVVVAR